MSINEALSQTELPTRRKLVSPPKEYQELAGNLLSALANGSRESIKPSISALVSAGGVELVIPLLEDPSDVVKQEAAHALKIVKTKRVAKALLSAIPSNDVAVRGGDEALLLRRETRGVFIDVLSHLFGTPIYENWTNEELKERIERRIIKMPD